MAKSYSTIPPRPKEVKKGPSSSSIQRILNYSRSIEAKNIKGSTLLLNLN